MERKVAIIGGGTSGLLACRYILAKGFTPIIFEALDDIGGVWYETIGTTTLQTPKELYQFSDHPWPDSVTCHYPCKKEVMDYLHSYADRFKLNEYIRFDSKVVSVRYEGAGEEEIEAWSYWNGTGEPFSSRGRWLLTIQNTTTVEEEQFDFVILTVGKYSGFPNIPVFPPGKGPQSFKGNVIHSMDCAKMEPGFMKAKSPVIVGIGKTALDIAMVCSAANGSENPCTLLHRSVHWAIPGNVPIPLGYLYLNRFSELLMHKPEEGFLHKLLATILSPLRWAISKYVGRAILKAVNLQKYDMVPKHGFAEEVRTCSAANLPQGFFERVDEGSIKLVKSQNFNFCENGILIEGKAEPIKTELVIFCTGFRGGDKVRDMFPSPFFKERIAASNDSLAQLYREMIHPRIPQLAVVGFGESISNLQTAEMMSRWVAELLDGNIKIPSIKEMEKNIAEWDKYMKPSPSSRKRSCVGKYNIWFNDKLCKDMGWNPRRKRSAFAEMFEPYGPLDYAQL